MATNAQVALGATLNRWNGSSWDEIVEVNSISWDGISREVIEVAKLNTTDEYINKLQGLLNANAITASIWYTKAQFTILVSDAETRGNQMYQIAFPNGEGLEFDGFISELPLELATDDAMMGDVTITIDGKADFLSAVS